MLTCRKEDDLIDYPSSYKILTNIFKHFHVISKRCALDLYIRLLKRIQPSINKQVA